MQMFNKKRYLVTATIAGTLFFAGAAQAVPVLETQDNLPGLTAATTTVYGAARDLVFSTNVSGAEIHKVAEANSLLLGKQIDALGKIDLPNSDNGSSFDTVTEFPVLPSGTVSDGALTVKCTSDKCASFDWIFNQALTTLSDDWNIVKIGVKYGGGNANDAGPAYFLLDASGTGADSGSFSILDYNLGAEGEFMLTDGDIADLFQTPQFYSFKEINDGPVCTGKPEDRDCPVVGYEYHLKGLSHVDFFGVQTAASIPEPGMLAIFGVGLLGLGVVARRRKAA